jgi:diguanylate cyclase (GGDEF)-like protein/PAS domain S-box-containing protein
MVRESARIEKALEESERRLSSLLANAPAYLYRCLNKPGWPNEFVSDYAYELTGYSPEELTNGSVMFGDLIVEEDRERVWEEVQTALAERRRFGLRYAIHRRDGELRYVEEHGQGVFGEDGKVVALEGVVHDVTGRELAQEALKKAEEKYRTLVEQIPAIVYVDTLVAMYTVVYMGPQVEDILGYPPQKFMDNPEFWYERVHPDDLEGVVAEDARTDETGEPFRMEYRMIARDGRVVWIRDEAVLIHNPKGGPLYWQGVMSDITERKEREEALRKSEANLAEAQRLAHVGSWEWDLRTGEIFWSDEVFRIYGFEPKEFVPDFERLVGVVHPDDRELLRRKIDGAVRQGEPYDFEHRIVRPNGEERVVHRRAEVVRDEDIEPLRMVGTVHDVTERKALEEQLQRQALHDPLTRLPNRVLFTDRLKQALRRARRRRGEVAVLFADLDNFKVVNDSLGHKTGDRLLVAVSKRIRTLLRPGDTVARLGGDEFVFLLEDTDVAGAVRVAERVSEELRAPFSLSGRQLFVTASVGVSVGGLDGKHAADLLRDADLAMYRAKHSGKARYALFEEVMNARALERLETEHGLRRALEHEEFVVRYQPNVRISSGEIVGFEALVRWEHPERGLLLPEEFVPLAEETGLIVPIGERVLEEACRRAREWQQQRSSDPPVVVCVNLSARQFRESSLAETIARILDEIGLDPRYLFLEVTESTTMSDAVATVAALEQLQDLGVRVMIDDFGTGYSSLSYLERFPVDYVKIHRSFVGGLGKDPGAAVLVSGVIHLAHALDLEVIAEGVETAEQLERLREMECDLAQGYLFSEPLPAQGVADLLAGLCHRNLRGRYYANGGPVH